MLKEKYMTKEQETQIQKVLDELAAKDKTGKIIALIIGAVLVIVAVIVTAATDSPVFLMFFGLFGVMAGCGAYALVTLGTKKRFKQTVLPIILKAELGPETQYFPNQGFDRKLLKELAFFPCTTYKGEDMLTGTYKGVDFMSADVYMYHQQSTGKTTTTVVDFKGTLWIFSLNKNISSRIDLYEHDYHLCRRPGYLSKIEFEDIDFNKMIKTYASDDHEAFYIITPPIIDNLKKNVTRIPGRVMYSFQREKVYMVVSSNENRLEYRRSKMNNVGDLVRQISADIEPIKETIDCFNLDVNIFKEKTEPINE